MTAAPHAVDARSRAYRTARAVSYLLNPLVFPPIGLALVHAHAGPPPAGAALLAALVTLAVGAVFYCFVPLGYIVRLVRSGAAESLEVRDRITRLRPLAVSIASYAVGAVALAATVDGPARPLILTFAVAFPLNTIGLLAITRRWKISLHLSSLAGFVAVQGYAAWTLPAAGALTLSAASVALLLPLLPLLMWARVRSGAHTPAQVVAGAAYGALVPLAEFLLVVGGP